jgi:hypothetical protein
MTVSQEFPFSDQFQFDVLCLYVRFPDKVGAVEPRYFVNPIHIDIARLVNDHREKHPDEPVLARHVLLEAVKAYLGRKRRDAWSQYKHTIKKIYRNELSNGAVVAEGALAFARERKFRLALVAAEKAVNSQDYDFAIKQFDALKELSAQHNSHLLHTKEDFVNSQQLTFSIEGFLQNGAATLIGGLSGHGKTWVMLSMARALLTGEPLWDYFKVPKKAKRVVYLIPESTIEPVKHRLKRMGLYKHALDGRLLVHTMSAGPKPKLDDPQILAVAKGSHIFLDTAIRFGSGEENSADANQKGLASDIFSLLSAGAKTVIGAHHSAKAFDKAAFMTLENVLRGTGDIGAMAATVWGVKQIDSTRNLIHIENVKARDFEPCKPFQIAGRPYIDRKGDFRMLKKPGTCGSLLSEQPQRERGGAAPELRESRSRNLEIIRRMLAKNPKKRSKDIAKRLGVAEATVRGYKRQIARE